MFGVVAPGVFRSGVPGFGQVAPGTEAVVGIKSFDAENPVTSLDELTTGYYVLFNANHCANYQRGGYICYEARATDRPLRCGTEESGSGDTKVASPWRRAKSTRKWPTSFGM